MTKLDAGSHAASASLPSKDSVAADVLLRRQLRRRSHILFALVSFVVVAGVSTLLSKVEPDRLVSAVVIVGAALVLAGLYATLIDKQHARLALVVAAGVGGAIAAVDQLLAHV